MDKIKRRGKRYLTYAITEDLEDEIRTYVNAINKRTGITKQRIVSDLIVAGMRGKKFYIVNQENQENQA